MVLDHSLVALLSLKGNPPQLLTAQLLDARSLRLDVSSSQKQNVDQLVTDRFEFEREALKMTRLKALWKVWTGDMELRRKWLGLGSLLMVSYQFPHAICGDSQHLLQLPYGIRFELTLCYLYLSVNALSFVNVNFACVIFAIALLTDTLRTITSMIGTGWQDGDSILAVAIVVCLQLFAIIFCAGAAGLARRNHGGN